MPSSFKYLLGICLITTVACDAIIELDLPKDEQRLVVNCALYNDTVVSLHLTKSTHILDTIDDYELVSNARIKLTKDGNEEYSLSYFGEGQYRSSHTPIVESNYAIEIIHPDFDPINSSLIMPSTPSLRNITTGIKSTQDFFGAGVDEFPSVNFEISDPVGKDFYTVEASLKLGLLIFVDQIFIDTIFIESPIVMNTDDPLLGDNTETFGSGDLIFSDEFFSSSNYVLETFYFDVFSEDEDPNSFLDLKDPQLAATLQQFGYTTDDVNVEFGSKSLLLKFGAITEDLFRYQLSRNLQNSASGNPFSQAVQVSNNIENGFGVFGGVSYSNYEVKIW